MLDPIARIIEMKTAGNKNSISTSGEDKTSDIQKIVRHQPRKAHKDILGCQRKKKLSGIGWDIESIDMYGTSSVLDDPISRVERDIGKE